MSTPFTVLMPVWQGDLPDRFRAAVASATTGQQLPPTELLITVDGELCDDLEAVLHEIERGDFGPSRVLRHPEHRGLACALQDGLENAHTEVIARADADDLVRPERFALQIPRMEADGLDLLGGAMQEFSDAVPRGCGPRRDRPLTHEEILAYLPHHSPFHHPTVVLRRSTALAAGGYRALDLLEDYWMWERMVLAGARCANLPDVLVDYRVDERLFARRGGLRLLAADVRLQRIMLRDNVTTPGAFVTNVVRRAGYRMMPVSARRFAYRRFVETRSRVAFGASSGSAPASDSVATPR